MSKLLGLGDQTYIQTDSTHPRAAGLNQSPGGGDPSPTCPLSLVKTWLDGTSAYGGQEILDISALAVTETLAGAETLGFRDVVEGAGEVVGGFGALENPSPPDP